MAPGLFLADLEEKPDRLRTLAERLEADDPWAFVGELDSPLVLLLGMGSSHSANEVAAARLRHAGVPAGAERAWTRRLPRVPPDTVVIPVSASGGSTETVGAVRWL